MPETARFFPLSLSLLRGTNAKPEFYCFRAEGGNIRSHVRPWTRTEHGHCDRRSGFSEHARNHRSTEFGLFRLDRPDERQKCKRERATRSRTPFSLAIGFGDRKSCVTVARVDDGFFYIRRALFFSPFFRQRNENQRNERLHKECDEFVRHQVSEIVCANYTLIEL